MGLGYNPPLRKPLQGSPIVGCTQPRTQINLGGQILGSPRVFFGVEPPQELKGVSLVREIEKLKDRKWRKDEKVEGYKRFLFHSFVFGWSGKKVEGLIFFFFCLVEKKNGRIENVVSINLYSYILI